MVPMLAYALLGGARRHSASRPPRPSRCWSRPRWPVSVGPAPPVPRDAAFTLTVLVGLCLLAMRLFRLGGLIENISPATLTGIRLGVGLTVAVSQLPALLGVGSDPDATGVSSPASRTLLSQAVGREHDDGRRLGRHASPVLVLQPSLRARDFLGQQPIVVAAGILLVATDLRWRTMASTLIAARADRSPPGISLPVVLRRLLVCCRAPGHLRDGVPRDGSRCPRRTVVRTSRRSTPTRSCSRSGVASVAGGFTQSAPARRRLLAECGEHPLRCSHPGGRP